MSKVVIITGMHRSGTSLVSNLLQKAGVHIGQQLLAPNIANPRGYFEDVDFYEFHEHLLHQRGQTYLYVDKDFTFDPTPAEVERAQHVLAERAKLPLWGWKDPRTALFLEFWHQLLPQARFLFVYRHPLEVLLSLLRRGEFDNHLWLTAGLQAWQVYNTHLKTFYEQHPTKCLLIHIDGLVSQVEQFIDLLQHKLQLDFQLNSATFGQIYHAKELKKTPVWLEVEAILAKLYPDLLELYHQLNTKADLPVSGTSPVEPAVGPISNLAKFVAPLSDPISLPIQQGVLQLLLALLAPEPTHSMLNQFSNRVKGGQQQVDQLWLQFQQLERFNAKQCELLQEQQAQLEAQAAYLEAQDAQLHEQHRVLTQQATRMQALLAELDRVYETRAWKLIQTYWSLKEKWQKTNL